MNVRKVLLALVAVVAVVAIVWLVRGRRQEIQPTPSVAGALPEGKPGAVAAPAAAPGVKVPPIPTLPPGAQPAATPPQALDRDDEVRDKVEKVLDKYPDVASLRAIECEPTGACKIEVKVDDLDNFRAPLELLQDPESGLSGDHKLMVLSKPEALGPKGTGPWLFTFQLTPPEGGIVKP